MPDHTLMTTAKLSRRSTKEAILSAIRECVKLALVEYGQTGAIGNTKPGSIQQAYGIAHELAVDDARRHAGYKVPRFHQFDNPSDQGKPRFDPDPKSVERRKAEQEEMATWTIGDPADVIQEIIEEHQLKQEDEYLREKYGEEIDPDAPPEERPSSRELIRRGFAKASEGFDKPRGGESLSELKESSLRDKPSSELTSREKISRGLQTRFEEDLGLGNEYTPNPNFPKHR